MDVGGDCNGSRRGRAVALAGMSELDEIAGASRRRAAGISREPLRLEDVHAAAAVKFGFFAAAGAFFFVLLISAVTFVANMLILGNRISPP